MYDKMNPIDVRIRKFIAQNQTLTLATCQDGAPYCCSLFMPSMNPQACCILCLPGIPDIQEK